MSSLTWNGQTNRKEKRLSTRQHTSRVASSRLHRRTSPRFTVSVDQCSHHNVITGHCPPVITWPREKTGDRSPKRTVATKVTNRKKPPDVLSIGRRVSFPSCPNHCIAPVLSSLPFSHAASWRSKTPTTEKMYVATRVSAICTVGIGQLHRTQVSHCHTHAWTHGAREPLTMCKLTTPLLILSSVCRPTDERNSSLSSKRFRILLRVSRGALESSADNHPSSFTWTDDDPPIWVHAYLRIFTWSRFRWIAV